MAKVLIVDDDTNLAASVVDWLAALEHHIVDHIDDGQQAADVLKTINYDIIILDWKLPSMPGIEVLRQFRSNGGKTPVIMLTGKDTLDDKEQGLNYGADDYLTKPFHVRELSARVRALLRRPKAISGNVLTAGKVALDPSGFAVTKDGEAVLLSRLEFAVLEFFLRHPGQVFSVETLLERVWPIDSERSPEGVRALIKRIRQKVDYCEPSLIQNVRGRGYKLELPRD